MNEIFSYENLEEGEFLKLIKIQRHFLAEIIRKEWKNYQKGLKLLNKQEQIKVEWHRKHTIALINDKIEEMIQKEMWNYGAIRLKDIYWRPHHLSLLPIIYKDYRDFLIRDIKFLCTGESVSAYLLNTYPHLKKSLVNIWQNYCEYRKELKKNKLSAKLGYGEELPNEEFLPNGFSLSTIVELLNEIKNKSFEKNKRDWEVIRMYAEGQKQEDIAKRLNISQGFVSKILHNRHSVLNYDVASSLSHKGLPNEINIDNPNIKLFFDFIDKCLLPE